jgi:hypothetical protein
MVKITKPESTPHHVTLIFDNGVVLGLCSHEDYIYLTLGGIELPTSVNQEAWKYNNVLIWNYKKAGYDEIK